MQDLNDKAPVAVIIPTFNRRDVLPRALESIRAQTLQPVEVCVVDDGSTDDTGELLANQYTEFQTIRQHNRGVSAARNLGVQNTHAPWIAFLDSDDEWLPEKLARQLALIDDSPDTHLVHCDELWIRNGRRVNPMRKHRKSGGDIFQQCLQMCAISPSAVLLRRELFEQTGGFDESLPACEDYDLWLRICSQHKVAYLDEPLLRKFGGHADQLSRKHWGMDRFRIAALNKLLESGGLDNQPERFAQTLMVLKEKCHILSIGAKKHGNDALLSQCEAVLRQYGLAHAEQN